MPKKYPANQPTEITKMPNGDLNVKMYLSPEDAANFFEACNIISEELGRPVSKAEALEHMTKKLIQDMKDQAH